MINFADIVRQAYRNGAARQSQTQPARILSDLPAMEVFGIAPLGAQGYTALARNIPFQQLPDGVQAAIARQGYPGAAYHDERG
jgi:hypothetical protein